MNFQRQRGQFLRASPRSQRRNALHCLAATSFSNAFFRCRQRYAVQVLSTVPCFFTRSLAHHISKGNQRKVSLRNAEQPKWSIPFHRATSNLHWLITYSGLLTASCYLLLTCYWQALLTTCCWLDPLISANWYVRTHYLRNFKEREFNFGNFHLYIMWVKGFSRW